MCISIHYFCHTTSLNLTFPFLIYRRFSVQKGGGNEFSFLFLASYNTWIHVGMIYKGPSKGEGISVYKDGLHVGDNDQGTQVSGWTTNNSGRLMIGRLFQLSADPEVAKHAEAVVDELLIWNRQLSADEIMK